MTHIVIKPFGGPGGSTFQPGQRVDASSWRNTDTLVSQRYLRPIGIGEPVELVKERLKGNRIQQAAQVAKEVPGGS